MKSKILQEGIRFTHTTLTKEKDRILKEIKELQEICPHTNAIKKNRGDSGNTLTGRDPSYWKECKCPDCGKIWTEDQ